MYVYIFKFSFKKSNSQNFHGCWRGGVRRGQGEGLGGIQGEGVGIHGDSRGFARIHEHSQTSVTTYGRRLTLLLWRWRRRAVKRGRGEEKRRRNRRRSGSERRETRAEEETSKLVQCFQHTQRHLDQCFFSTDTTIFTRLPKGVFLTKIN